MQRSIQWGRVILVVFLTSMIAMSSMGVGLAVGFGVGRITAPKSSQVAIPVGSGGESTGKPTPVIENTPATPSSPQAPSNFDVFWEVLNILNEHFYGDVPQGDEITYAAIRGLLKALNDPYTSFMDPKTAKIFSSDMSGTFEGIGARVEQAENGGVRLVHVFPGSPAEKAGLKDGDIIIKVDGEDITGLTLLEQVMKIRGPAGSEVVLTIIREGERDPIDVTVVRGRIEIPIVEYRMEGEYAYIKFMEFNALGVQKVRDAYEELAKNNPKGLILDIRNNPGGFLHVAIGVTSLFLPDGKVVLIERWKDGREKVYKSDGGGIAKDIPMVVLVNRGSASASEILAGALQDHGRATIIGERTLGKGSVQQPFTLSDGSELRVTIAHWLTPNGREIHGYGIDPDIPVEVTEEDEAAGRDPVLERAIEYLESGK